MDRYISQVYEIDMETKVPALMASMLSPFSLHALFVLTPMERLSLQFSLSRVPYR